MTCTHVNNLVGDVKANPRDFYRYINSQRKDTQGIPPLKKKNGSGIAQSDFEKAEEFNGQFTDVFTKTVPGFWFYILAQYQRKQPTATFVRQSRPSLGTCKIPG